MLPKAKTPFKIHFLSEQKHHHQDCYFPEGVMSLHLSKFGFDRGILIFAKLKGAK